jgi:hypothetical protein
MDDKERKLLDLMLIIVIILALICLYLVSKIATLSNYYSEECKNIINWKDNTNIYYMEKVILNVSQNRSINSKKPG